jgi:hypothetical protein
MEINRGPNCERNRDQSGPQPAITARMAEQFRAWSGPPLLGLGCIIGYRAVANGAVVAGLLLATAMAGLGAVRSYYLVRYLRAKEGP